MRAEIRHFSQPSAQLWEVVEECVYAYELDFRDGRQRSLDQYLPDGNASLRRTVLTELIKVELELECKQGSAKSLRMYCDRYPELGAFNTLPPDLVYEAYLAAAKQHESVDIEQFCSDFPQQRQAVLSLAHRTVNQSTAITRQKPGGQWQVGTRFGDFQLLALLGEGAFGRVFLAEQVSLARQVALKVTANRGSEARTMASLEHDNIVQVFSELILPQCDARLLCMQYVPGTTLGKVIRYLAERPGQDVSGASIITAIDDLSTVAAVFQATALKERQQLAEADLLEAVTLIGGRLAEALAYAHERGVLHRDIKPDNVLVSQYGRPLLVDFNLSLDPHQIAGTSAGLFGGSLAYMSPEHLDAFNPANPTSPEAVDERSDLYSLGVTLFELFQLRRPFPDLSPGTNPLHSLEDLAAQRRAGTPLSDAERSPQTDLLEMVVQRCLEPKPEHRYQSAAELCGALDAARQLHGIRKAMPQPGRLMQLALRWPLTMLVLSVLVPSFLGSAVNISYNVLRILPELTTGQRSVFATMLLGYNLIVYPICSALMIYRAIPIFFPSANIDSARLRKRIVSLPLWIVALGAIGWLPGGLVFPWGIHLAAGPLDPAVFGHFLIDFVMSGLIAVTYSYFGAEAILLRVLYPRHLVGQAHPQEAAAHELSRLPLRINIAQAMAGLIPLIGAILIVLSGPAEAEGYSMFRLLVTALIALGMLGFCFSTAAVSVLRQTLQAFSGIHLPTRSTGH